MDDAGDQRLSALPEFVVHRSVGYPVRRCDRWDLNPSRPERQHYIALSGETPTAVKTSFVAQAVPTAAHGRCSIVPATPSGEFVGIWGQPLKESAVPSHRCPAGRPIAVARRIR